VSAFDPDPGAMIKVWREIRKTTVKEITRFSSSIVKSI
jgi:hypothetical protein